MRTDVVLTVTGPDRVGIVEEVTQALLAVDGNVGTSRMARLGGEFAILMLASVPADTIGALEGGLGSLASEGYRVAVTPTHPAASVEQSTWPAYRIDIEGADHEGIVHEIVRGLAGAGISIESMETGTSDAPTTGATLFTMRAVVAVPPGLDEAEWQASLSDAAEASSVDVEVFPL